MDPIDRAEFVTTCRIALNLASAPEVVAAWDSDSTCAGMTVGALTHHVLGPIRHVAGLLTETTDQEPIPLLDHYTGADWVTAGLQDEANTSIRDGANEAATAGADAVLNNVGPLLDRIPGLLGRSRDPDTVLIPWQGWALTTDDFLVTRAMELVVHSDNLAASVGLPTPAFPDNVVDHVVHLLAGLALRRHGQTAVIRKLSRPQRAPQSISAL